MAWKPKLPQVSAEVVPVTKRPWVAVAEQHAEAAVNFFVNTMRNQRLSHKVRMEAATRIVMIAGATFRGERVDGSGRPAANLPSSNASLTKLPPDALRQALRALPPDAVIMDPEEAKEGERYVVLQDSDHSRKPTGHVVQSPVASLVEGQTPKEEAEAIMEARLEANRKKEEEEAQRAEMERVKREEMDAFEALKELTRQVKNKSSHPELFQTKKLKDRFKNVTPQPLVLPVRADDKGDAGASGEAGQADKLGGAESVADSQEQGTEDASPDSGGPR